MNARFEREKDWQRRWTGARAFEAEVSQDAYVAFDSAPFTNGMLHLGHARNYVLGDVDARFQRLMGRRVIYTTNFDAFGLPILARAEKLKRSPYDLAAFSRRSMTADMVALGLSYDWKRVRSTTDGSMIAGTQRLFLTLFRKGVIERRVVPSGYCPRCRTTLDDLQVSDGCCERCGSRVTSQTRPQWVVNLAAGAQDLTADLDALSGWSDRAKNLMRSVQARDWVLGRQRSYGTPIPVLHCARCGIQPVPDNRLPFRPERPGQNVACPRCGGPAAPDADRLDCVFDDCWCFLSWDGHGDGHGDVAAAPFTASAGGPGGRAFPIDIFHGGYDTFIYPWLYRFMARHLYEIGMLASAEPVRRYLGHDMILSGGAKMGKSLGNATAVRDLLDRDGADVLRSALILAARPDKPVQWSEDILDKGRWAVGRIEAWARRPSDRSKRGNVQVAVARSRRFYADYRPHAAFETVLDALDRIPFRPIGDDGWQRSAELIALMAPVVPHLAETLWRDAGGHCLLSVLSLEEIADVRRTSWPT